jgi:hypothetical protein
LWDHLDPIEVQAEHALLLETTPELPSYRKWPQMKICDKTILTGLYFLASL